MLLMLAAAVLVPVAHDDPLLASEDSFVSSEARNLILAKADGIHCLDAKNTSRSYETICLTREEWQAAADRAAVNASIERRQRAVGLAQWYATPRSVGR